MDLYEDGTLDQLRRQAAGHHPPTPSVKAEDRQGFKDTMESISQPCVVSKVVHTVEDAVEFANSIGLSRHRPSRLHPGRHRRRHRL